MLIIQEILGYFLIGIIGMVILSVCYLPIYFILRKRIPLSRQIVYFLLGVCVLVICTATFLEWIPVVGCDTLSSALCMDKDRAHKLVSLAGISVPKSVTFKRFNKEAAMKEIEANLTYPLFIKPVRAGSSFGITKVIEKQELDAAIELAFEHDTEVIVEETINGFEVGCAVLGIDELIVGRVDEIELSSGFFDYTEKYTLKSSKIYMPARIDAEAEKRIQETAVTIYKALGCSGFSRVDMFYTPSGEIVFNEVNTIPGFTSHSRYPNMMKGIGLSFAQMLDKLIGLYVE